MPALLLEDLAWARRLAYRLTHDVNEADDLVQDAYLVTQTHPPRDGEPLRPWLYRVMQNLTRMRFRSASRRTRRELAVLVHDDANVGEQLEAHRLLASAMQTLREPYRTTLFHRYYDDLSAAEIAARQGLPAATVRWRIKEGLRLLEEQLDEEHGGRAAWRAALLPFARSRSADGSAKTASPSAREGASLMTSISKLFLAATAVTAAVVGVTAIPKTTHVATPAAAIVASNDVSAVPAAAVAPAAAPPRRVTAVAKKIGGATTSERFGFGIGFEGLENAALTPSIFQKLYNCLLGIDGKPRPSAKFSLSLVPTDDGAKITKVTPTGAPLYSELEHPAVQACLDASLRGERLDAKIAAPTVVGMVLTISSLHDEAGEDHVAMNDDNSKSPSLGRVNAPVTLVEYSDFECLFCAQAAPLVHQLADKYGADLQIVFRENPLPFHAHAALAAEAALAANDQGQFWPLHDAMFAAQKPLDRAKILELASQLPLDLPRFTAALDSHAFAADVAQDQAVARAHDLNGTPAFTVNGRVIMGVRPLAEFTRVIDEELAKR